MFVYLILLLTLSYVHTQEADTADLKDGTAFDQMAEASETSIQSAKQTLQKPQDLRDQLIPSMIDASAHYENSNGFLPIVVVATTEQQNLTLETSGAPILPKTNDTSENKFSGDQNHSSPDDSGHEIEEEGVEQDAEPSIKESEKIEDDPAYSTEARIFLNLHQSGTNRRSFDFQGSQNEFELLKVRNNTPAVANYREFYENIQNVVENSKGEEDSSGRAQNGVGETGTESHLNYATLQGNNGDSSYNIYYPYNTARDVKKATYDQEKAAINYREQDAVEYDGHGQSSTRQSGLTASSLARTHQKINELSQDTSSNRNHSFDNVAEPSGMSRQRHRFTKPVVVAEPSNYNVDFKYSDQPSTISELNANNYQTSRFIESSSSEMGGRYAIYSREGKFRTYGRDDDSRDASDVSADYADYSERPKRIQKGRRRPYASESSRRPSKEHRAEDSSEYEDHGKRHHLSRSKSQRHRVKSESWSDDDRNRGKDESFEETRHGGRSSGASVKGTRTHQTSKIRPSNTWNQITPNLEISHSSGVELDQIEKPKLIVPFKLNFLPLANFDHATALGNSQGFDMSNALLQNVATVGPVNTVTGSGNHLLNTPQNNVVGGQNLEDQNVARNIHQGFGVSTSGPDVIVGQNTFQNPLQTMIYPHPVGQNKFQAPNLRQQYLSTTVGPLYAMTPTFNPALQSVTVQNAASSTTPRPTYIATPTPSTNVQQISLNQIHPGLPQLIVPQPTFQTLPNLVQPVQSIPLVTTVAPGGQQLSIGKVNLPKADTQNKKSALPGSIASFLATANLAVGQNEQRQISGGNSYYLQNSNAQQIMRPQSHDGFYQYLKSVDVTPKPNTFIQTTHIMPAVMHHLPSFTAINANPQQLISGSNQNLVGYQNTGDNTIQQMQLQFQRDQLFKTNKPPAFQYQSVDNMGSTSNSNVNVVNTLSGVTGFVENAHLPNVGTRNVEILNPNIKPSPMDTTVVNTYETLQYPTAVLTTPIPMFSTTSFVTARPAVISTTTSDALNPQSYVGSFTELGAKTNQLSTGDFKTDTNQERPIFNPVNFVPNMEVVKSQNVLNGKPQSSEALQQNLNLVPLIPGGNFFKPTFGAQSELLVKPKLTADLEKYAEQMFKESLKTMYHSHKWNSDRKPAGRQNVSDSIDLSKLKNELQRLKASLSDTKSSKDMHEAHQSENKIKIAELMKNSNFWNEKKKPDQLAAALEQMLKSHSKDHAHGYRGHGSRPGHSQRHHEHSFDDDLQESKRLRDFLTPPKVHSHGLKSHFHDKPGKKRPGSGRFHHHHHHGSRPHPRPRQTSVKSTGLEAAASNIDLGYHSDAPFDSIPHRFFRDRDLYERRKPTYSFDSYPSITTSKPDSIDMTKLSRLLKSQQGQDLDINHPRIHNLMGLLMKNKQLPPGNDPNYFRDKDQLREFFDDEKRRQQQQFYDDTLRDYLTKSSVSNAFSDVNFTGSRRAFKEKSKS